MYSQAGQETFCIASELVEDDKARSMRGELLGVSKMRLPVVLCRVEYESSGAMS